jgi:hypothetical protein
MKLNATPNNIRYSKVITSSPVTANGEVWRGGEGETVEVMEASIQSPSDGGDVETRHIMSTVSQMVRKKKRPSVYVLPSKMIL